MARWIENVLMLLFAAYLITAICVAFNR